MFNYSRLTTKNLDEMNHLVHEKIKESRKESGDKSIPLKEALQAVFSRPNEDDMIEKILPALKAELEDLGSWEHSIENLVKEAVGALKNPKAFKADAQVTYEIFLENIISEFKPRQKEKFEHRILLQIRDAKIELSKEALSERELKMMRELPSPSEIADKVLKEAEASAASPAAAPSTK